MNHFSLILLITFSVFIESNSHFLKPRKIQPRIFGGAKTELGQFTYQVSLRRIQYTVHGQRVQKYQRISHFCGGSLLSERWIVSAAHCTSKGDLNLSELRAVVGAYDREKDGTTYCIEKIINHPEFDKLYLNDLSLLKTSERVRFGQKVAPISISKDFVQADESAMVLGWGTEEDGFPAIYLKSLKVKIISNAQCIASHSEKHAENVYDSTICSQKIGKEGTSHGDSGGPLVLSSNQRLIGVISWGVHSETDRPDQYTRLSSYIDWIKQITDIEAI